MTGALIGLQIVVALFLILVVLLQPGNRGGATAALGGSGSETVFGSRGANTFLSKLTVGAAVLFMLTNFSLSMLSGRQTSVLDAVPAPASAPKPSESSETAKPDQPAGDAAPAVPGSAGAAEPAEAGGRQGKLAPST
ncbi:MAG: preprotein translocase subunit SecG [Myxococcota bacterium]